MTLNNNAISELRAKLLQFRHHFDIRFVIFWGIFTRISKWFVKTVVIRIYAQLNDKTPDLLAFIEFHNPRGCWKNTREGETTLWFLWAVSHSALL